MTEIIDALQCSDSLPFVVRPATPDDAPALIEYLKIILSDPMASIADLDEMLLDVHHQREHLRRTQSSPNSIALVAVHSREIIGFVTMEPGRRRKISHTVELGMSVREDWRGHGVGHALVERAEAWARANGGFEKIVLNVFSGNLAARRLYEKAGFVNEGRLRGQVKIGGERQDLILMAKYLEPGPCPMDV